MLLKNKIFLIISSICTLISCNNTKTQKMIICVPGSWGDRQNLENTVLKRSGGYSISGNNFLKNGKATEFTLEISGKDSTLAQAFMIAGQGKISTETIEKIKNHNLILYVLSDKLGLESIHDIMDLSCGLIDSGGIAIKIETAGVAHEGFHWKQVSKQKILGEVYRLFTVLVKSKTDYYSCGMQNFGFPDSDVGLQLTTNEADDLIFTFNIYQIAERPMLKTGETFSVNSNAQWYRLQLTDYDGYGQNEPLYNQFGKWKLIKHDQREK